MTLSAMQHVLYPVAIFAVCAFIKDQMPTSSNQTSLPICKVCGRANTLLGILPKIGLGLAVQVFRCMTCNTVASMEVQRD
jgi:hypothetical protein